METIIEVTIGVVFVGFSLLFLWCLAKHQQNKNFRRFMKAGDWCKYYEDYYGDHWQIMYLVGDKALIYNHASTQLLEVPQTDLYV
jgi:hypothetical protein